MNRYLSNKKSPNKLEQFLNSENNQHHSFTTKIKKKFNKPKKDPNFFKSKSWFEFLAK